MASTRQERYNLIYGNTARQLEPTTAPKRPAYEPKRRRPEPKKQVTPRTKRNQSRAYAFDFNFICVMAVACAIVFMVSFVYLSQRTQLLAQQNTLAAKKTQLNTLVTENEDLALEIEQSLDLSKIEETAISKYGMKRPDGNKVITYKSKNSDYVRQYGSIPSTN